MPGTVFADRRDAGRRLAEAVGDLALSHPVVLALPRGGVPVAYEVARRLGAPLDVVLVRKLGAPGHAEFGIGAVVDGASPQVVLNAETARMHLPPGYVEAETARQLAEIERRRAAYVGDRPPPAIAGRSVVVVDDGVATGGTARAALAALRRAGCGRLVLAVPVAAPEALAALRASADEIVCLAAPPGFAAVGAHYADFAQTSDLEVTDLLAAARNAAGDARA